MPSDARDDDAQDMRRTISPFAAWALSLGCTVGWGSFVMPSSTFLPKAGPLGTAIAFAIGMLAMLVIAANYGYMAQNCIDESGVYAYARMTFGTNHAFVCSWCLVLAYCSAMVSNATAFALVVRSVFGPVLQVGPHYVVAGYDVYLGEALSGMIVIALMALVCMRSTRLVGWLEIVLVAGMVVGTAAIGAMVLQNPQATLSTLRPAFSPNSSPLAGTLMVIAAVPWAYVGFESVSQVAAECDFKAQHFGRVMMAAVLVGTGLYLVLNTVTAAVVPDGYTNWVAYLADLHNVPDATAIPLFQAGYRMAGTAGLYLFGLTAFCAVMSGVVGFYIAASRLVWEMAADGTLNHRLARLHDDFRTPVAAIMAITAVTLVMPFLGRIVLNWIVDLMSLGALVAYLYTSLATVIVGRKSGSTRAAVLGTCGVVVSVACLALLIMPVPQLGTSLTKESYVILFAWIALGVNFYTPTVSRS